MKIKKEIEKQKVPPSEGFREAKKSPFGGLGAVSEALLTRKELADYLKVSPSTIWRYVKQNRIQAYSIVGKRYYKKTEIDNNLIQLKN